MFAKLMLSIVAALSFVLPAQAQWCDGGGDIQIRRRGLLPFIFGTNDIRINVPNQCVPYHEHDDDDDDNVIEKLIILDYLRENLDKPELPVQLPVQPQQIRWQQPPVYVMPQQVVPQYIPAPTYYYYPQRRYYYQQQPLGIQKPQAQIQRHEPQMQPVHRPSNRQWRVQIDPNCQSMAAKETAEMARRNRVGHYNGTLGGSMAGTGNSSRPDSIPTCTPKGSGWILVADHIRYERGMYWRARAWRRG